MWLLLVKLLIGLNPLSWGKQRTPVRIFARGKRSNNLKGLLARFNPVTTLTYIIEFTIDWLISKIPIQVIYNPLRNVIKCYLSFFFFTFFYDPVKVAIDIFSLVSIWSIGFTRKMQEFLFILKFQLSRIAMEQIPKALELKANMESFCCNRMLECWCSIATFIAIQYFVWFNVILADFLFFF